MGFAEIARADAKFFDRACEEGIGNHSAHGSHSMLVHEMGKKEVSTKTLTFNQVVALAFNRCRAGRTCSFR
jgi:hypothetical protein